MSYDENKFVTDIDLVLGEIRRLLIEKNKAYGNSVFEPLMILSKLSVRDRIFVRIEDKLNRAFHGEDLGEDTLLDLLGYLILERIDAHRKSQAK
jgi:hypothetical protein